MTVPAVPPGLAEVTEALRSIASDPDYGSEALSSGQTMESLLKDLLPDKPREAAILVAAAEHGLAALLRERVDQEGMDAKTAIRLVAAAFAKATAFAPEACEWAVTELAVASGMDATVVPAVMPTGDRSADPVHSAVTVPPAPITAPQTAVTAVPDEKFAPPGQETAPAPRTNETPSGYDATSPQPTLQPKRRAVWYAVALAVATVVIVIVALPQPAPPAPVIAVTAASANNTVHGNVYVYYKFPGHATATITATVLRGVKGEVAKLTGQIYPFTSEPTVLASVPITGRYQRLSIPVRPSLETRYRVEVLRSARAPKVVATSPVTTVYVALIARYQYDRNRCLRPTCFVTIQFRVPVARAALLTESKKRVYFYWGINLAPTGPEPPDPTRLELQKLTTEEAIPTRNGRAYQMILPFEFTVNQDAYRWHWNICTKASLSADGIGLPGPGQCGRDTVAASSPGYLGSLAG